MCKAILSYQLDYTANLLYNPNTFISVMEMYNLINGCIEMEKAVASIYSTFMQLFPKEKGFWEDLFMDEMEHLSFLSGVDYFRIINEPQTTVLPPSMLLLEKTLKFANNINKQIEINPVSLEDALKMALKLEETVVETFANELIANLSVADKEVLIEKILLGERLHVDKIKEMMIKKSFLKLS